MEKSRQTKAIHNALDADPFVVKTFSAEQRQETNASAETAADIAKLQKDGFVIIEKLLQPSQVQQVRDALAPHLGQTGRNNFEGTRTQRVYGLLNKSRAFDLIAEHPRVMAILDKLMLPNPLLTAYQAINILPGETAQPFHHDDQFVPLPRPHPPLSIATVWAIDDFGADNGATQVIPGSHLWGDRLPSPEDKPISAVMPSGSVVVFLSTLWHGGGPNSSNRQRLAISAQYCEPYIRPQENQFLIVPPAVVPTLSPRLQSLIGYSIHPPFIGHANGVHPLKSLPNPWKEQMDSSQQAKL